MKMTRKASKLVFLLAVMVLCSISNTAVAEEAAGLCTVIGPYCDSQGNCGWTSENLCCLWECLAN